MLVPQRGDVDIANTQYVHHFSLLGRGVVGMGGSLFDDIFVKKALYNLLFCNVAFTTLRNQHFFR